MQKEVPKKRSVTVDDTIKALKAMGSEITEKEAEIILDFLYFLAKLSVNQYLNTDYDNTR